MKFGKETKISKQMAKNIVGLQFNKLIFSTAKH